ncbi:hypothetical protein TWF506_006923 [Arthrobotrys conoides]|uniref:Uncharacterized protein n=1 Tax=Arthrobotrys conoides TaxID=74498 RepID=A0AAN8NA98_9PEZI
MATVNVNLKGVAYTKLETPTPLTPTYTYAQFKHEETKPENTAKNIADTLVGRQQGPGTAITLLNKETENHGGTPTEKTSTHTFSIVTQGFVVATFTAVGTVVGPPRGVSQPSKILPPWEIILIFLSTALFCIIFFRAMYHHRRLDMMTKKEDEANGIANPAVGNNEASNDDLGDAVEMKNISVDVPHKAKTGTTPPAPKLNTKYIPKDHKDNNQKGRKKVSKKDKA